MAETRIKVRSAELNGIEMDLHQGDDDAQLRQALETGPGAVHFHLTDGRRVNADDNPLGRRIVDVLFRQRNAVRAV